MPRATGSRSPCEIEPRGIRSDCVRVMRSMSRAENSYVLRVPFRRRVREIRGSPNPAVFDRFERVTRPPHFLTKLERYRVRPHQRPYYRGKPSRLRTFSRARKDSEMPWSDRMRVTRARFRESSPGVRWDGAGRSERRKSQQGNRLRIAPCLPAGGDADAME
jgi:hypothetical protein